MSGSVEKSRGTDLGNTCSSGVALLSFWPEGRDNGSCAGQPTASSACGGIDQRDGAFTTAFQKFAG